MNIQAATFDDLYRDTLRAVSQGDRVSPRGLATRELRGAHLILEDPAYNLLDSPARGHNLSFMVAEWIWHMAGRTDLAFVEAFNPNIGNWANDVRTFDGAYGPKIVDQIPYVVDTLREDPSSRQALITIWRESPRDSKDIPCTILFHFMIRSGVLEMITYMRSNDVWFGLPYDLFNFTMIQRSVAQILGVPPGPYHHIAGSLHMYQEGPSGAAFEQWEEVYEELYRPMPTSMPVGSGASPARRGCWPIRPWVEGSAISIASGGDFMIPDNVTPRERDSWLPYLSMLQHRFTGNTEALWDPFWTLITRREDS